jgi:hypothetical protein
MPQPSPSSVPATSPSTYEEFWPIYLQAHANPKSRGLHYLGTASGTLLVLTAVTLLLAGAVTFNLPLMMWGAGLFLAAPIAGYGCAWIGHFGIERNKPAAFSEPFWAFKSDYRMFWLWATGRLGGELAKAGVT